MDRSWVVLFEIVLKESDVQSHLEHLRDSAVISHKLKSCSWRFAYLEEEWVSVNIWSEKPVLAV